MSLDILLGLASLISWSARNRRMRSPHSLLKYQTRSSGYVHDRQRPQVVNHPEPAE